MPRRPNDDYNFIQRLHKIICNPANNYFVQWAPENKGFIISDDRAFTNQILIRKFGIGRFDSFIRKLNKFGFKRSKICKGKIRFFHKQFTKDSKYKFQIMRSTIDQIRKLSKQESLPKHIKLRMMRQKLWSQSGSDENCIESGQKIGANSNTKPQLKKCMNQQAEGERCRNQVVGTGQQINTTFQKQDIGIYLVKQNEPIIFRLAR